MSDADDRRAFDGGHERRHRALTDEDAQAIAEHISDKLIERLSDERTAQHVIGVWSGHLDQQIGKGVRRLLFYVGIALLGIAAVKFELFAKLFR